MSGKYIVDTTFLYGIDPLFKARKHLGQYEPRTKEILGNFIDAYLDDESELQLIIPDIEERLSDKRPLPLLASYLWKKDSKNIVAPLNLSLDEEHLNSLFKTNFQAQVHGAKDAIKQIAEFHLHPDISGGHTVITGEPDSYPGVPKSVAKAVKEEFRRIDDNYSEYDALLIKATFGFYQRGATYAATAKEKEGIYMTHPYRWSACGTWEKKQESNLESNYISSVLVHLLPVKGFENPSVLLKGLDILREESVKAKFSERLNDVVLAIKKDGDSDTVRKLMKKLQADSWWFTQEWAQPSLKGEELEATLRVVISGIIATVVAQYAPNLLSDPLFQKFLANQSHGWNLAAKAGMPAAIFASSNKLLSMSGIGVKPGTKLTLPKWVGDVFRKHVQIELPLPKSFKQSCPYCGAPKSKATCNICLN